MKSGSVLLLLLAIPTLPGCVTLSEKAARIQVHSQISNLLDSCKKLGPVTATATGFWHYEKSPQMAIVKLREEAADRGGDTVAILNTDKIFTGTIIHGVAFKCY